MSSRVDQPRVSRHSRSYYFDVSFQAQTQNLESRHRSFDASAAVSTSSPNLGFDGAGDHPLLCLPCRLTTRKPYGELLRKVLSDLNLPHLLVEGPSSQKILGAWVVFPGAQPTEQPRGVPRWRIVE